jgi:hypothetical protein
LLDPGVLAQLKALRGPGESYSDIILRVAKGEGREATPAKRKGPGVLTNA